MQYFASAALASVFLLSIGVASATDRGDRIEGRLEGRATTGATARIAGTDRA